MDARKDFLGRFIKWFVKPGPANAETTDMDIAQPARYFGYCMGVPYQVLEHIMKLERRIAVLESAKEE